MNSSSLGAAWKPIALVAAGAVIGGLIVWLAHQPHVSDKTSAGTPVAAVPAAALSQSQPESIDIGNARIPPPMPAAPVASSPAANQEMSWSGVGPGQTPGGVPTPGSVQSIGVPGRQIDYQTTASGYPIITGRKAIDSLDPAQIGQPGSGTIDPGGWRTDPSDSAPHLGPKGLIENPSVDPPSSHGAAYSRPAE